MYIKFILYNALHCDFAPFGLKFINNHFWSEMTCLSSLFI